MSRPSNDLRRIATPQADPLVMTPTRVRRSALSRLHSIAHQRGVKPAKLIRDILERASTRRRLV